MKKHSVLITFACFVIAIFSSSALAVNNVGLNSLGDKDSYRQSVRSRSKRDLKIKLCNANKSTAKDVEILFEFHPRHTHGVPEDILLTAQRNGETRVVLYDYYRFKVNAVYQGKLSKAFVTRLIARIEKALKEVRQLKPSNDNLIVEGDLFHLSIRRQSGVSKESGKITSELPVSAQSLIKDLSGLWKQLKKAPSAEAYIKTAQIGAERLNLLLREGKLRFIALQDFPSELQSILSCAIMKRFDFYPISLTQLNQLKIYASYGEVYITDKSKGYQLSLFVPRP